MILRRQGLCLIMLIVWLAGCASQAEPTSIPTPTVQPTIEPTSVPTFVPSAVPTIEPTPVPVLELTKEPEPTATPQNFSADLVQALTMANRDYDALLSFMSDPFAISGWQSSGVEWSREEALQQIQDSWLPPSALPIRPAGVDVATLIDSDPDEMFPDATEIVFMQGWGVDGSAEVLLIIGADESDAPVWRGVLIAPTGFVAQPVPAPAPVSLDEFRTKLIDILTTLPTEYGMLMALMDDPFALSGWQSSGGEFSPSEATIALRDTWIPADTPLRYWPDTDIAALVDMPASEMFPNAVETLFIDGWGADGSAEAILTIGTDENGDPIWNGLLIAPVGFVIDEGAPAKQITDYQTFRDELLDALIAETRDYDLFASFMNTPFMLAGWQSSGSEWEPAEAVVELRENWLPSSSYISYRLDADFAGLLGSNPETMFPDAHSLILFSGWGNDGEAEAILVISKNNAGIYGWSGVVIAPTGFTTE